MRVYNFCGKFHKSLEIASQGKGSFSGLLFSNLHINFTWFSIHKTKPKKSLFLWTNIKINYLTDLIEYSSPARNAMSSASRWSPCHSWGAAGSCWSDHPPRSECPPRCFPEDPGRAVPLWCNVPAEGKHKDGTHATVRRGSWSFHIVSAVKFSTRDIIFLITKLLWDSAWPYSTTTTFP